MPTTTIDAPSTPPESVELLFLETYLGREQPGAETPLRYFQTCRIKGVDAAKDRDWYERERSRYFARFRDLLSSAAPDTIMRAASSRELNVPYFAIAQTLFPKAHVVDGMVKAPGASCGAEASVERVLRHSSFRELPDVADLGHIVLIDDMYSSGCTAAVAIGLLRQRGRKFRRMTLAVPLNTSPSALASASGGLTLV